MILRRMYYGYRSLRAYLGELPVHAGPVRIRVCLVSPQDLAELLRAHPAPAGHAAGGADADMAEGGRARPAGAGRASGRTHGPDPWQRMSPLAPQRTAAGPEKQRLWETLRGQAGAAGSAPGEPGDGAYLARGAAEACSRAAQRLRPGFPDTGDGYGSGRIAPGAAKKTSAAGPGQGGSGDGGHRLRAGTWPQWIRWEEDALAVLQSFDYSLEENTLELK